MLGGYAPPRVDNGYRNFGVLPHRSHPDCRCLGRVPSRVGQQVADDLDNAPPVRHHQGEVGRQVDVQAVPAPAAQEGVAGQVHQHGHLSRPGIDRQCASLDAGHVQQVANQVAHIVGLVYDDAEELAQLGRVQLHRGVQHGGCRAPDGGQRGPQFVAHHAEELGPQPFLLLQRGQVLQRDHEGLDAALIPDGRGVEQDGYAATVGNAERYLFGAHRLPGAQGLGQRPFLQGDLQPVGAPDSQRFGQHLQELLQGLVRLLQAVHDPRHLPVEGHRRSRPGVEDHHSHRRGFHQGFQGRPGPLLVPVAAGVGDDHGGLGSEHHQGLLVLPAEFLAGFPLRHVDVAHPAAPWGAPVKDGNRQERTRGRGRAELGQAHSPGVAGKVRHPPRARDGVDILEYLRPSRHLPQPLRLGCGKAGGQEVLHSPCRVQGGHHAVLSAGQRPGAVQDPLQNRVQLQAVADEEAGLAEAGLALQQHCQAPVIVVCLRLRQLATSPAPLRSPPVCARCISP